MPAAAHIIGLSGAMRSGKDTAAAALIADGWEPRKFAAGVYAMAYALDPLIPAGPGSVARLTQLVDALGWEQVKDTHPEARRLLQRVGTEAGRGVLGPDVWVDAAFRCLPRRPVVFTDVRFVNEADAITDRGGIIVRIVRPGFEPPAGAHSSETSLEGYEFDHTVVNDGTLEDLHHCVRAIAALHWPTSWDAPAA